MKVLYTATVLSHICQFHLPYLQMFQENGCEVHVASHDNLALKNGLSLKYCNKFWEIPFSRSPLTFSNLKACRRLETLLNREHYHWIICNTPMGGVITRLAARKARKQGTKVIYIAHGFHFCKGSSWKSWVIFYPIERMMAHFCDTLITITREDYKLARRKFAVHAEHFFGMGVDSKRFHPIDASLKHQYRVREGLAEDDFVILCVGELNRNKNQSTLIRATALLKDRIPHLKVLLAGNGPLENQLKTLVKELQLEQHIRFLGYRTDLQALTPAVDLAVSCSLREGMPFNILEALMCNIPVVASGNRGHRELISAEYRVENGMDYHAFAEKIESVYQNIDKGTKNACRSHLENYTVEKVKQRFLRLLTLSDSQKEENNPA